MGTTIRRLGSRSGRAYRVYPCSLVRPLMRSGGTPSPWGVEVWRTYAGVSLCRLFDLREHVAEIAVEVIALGPNIVDLGEFLALLAGEIVEHLGFLDR